MRVPSLAVALLFACQAPAPDDSGVEETDTDADADADTDADTDAEPTTFHYGGDVVSTTGEPFPLDKVFFVLQSVDLAAVATGDIYKQNVNAPDGETSAPFRFNLDVALDAAWTHTWDGGYPAASGLACLVGAFYDDDANALPQVPGDRLVGVMPTLVAFLVEPLHADVLALGAAPGWNELAWDPWTGRFSSAVPLSGDVEDRVMEDNLRVWDPGSLAGSTLGGAAGASRVDLVSQVEAWGAAAPATAVYRSTPVEAGAFSFGAPWPAPPADQLVRDFGAGPTLEAGAGLWTGEAYDDLDGDGVRDAEEPVLGRSSGSSRPTALLYVEPRGLLAGALPRAGVPLGWSLVPADFDPHMPSAAIWAEGMAVGE